MVKSKIITVQGREISIITNKKNDYISLTDIARHKNNNHTDDIVKNWLRNRNTIELLGFWEQIHNPDFKPVEFDGFRKQAGLNSFTDAIKENLISKELNKSQINFVYANEADFLNMALFGLTAKQWCDEIKTEGPEVFGYHFLFLLFHTSYYL